MKDDAVYLRHIMECIRRVEENVSGGHEKSIRSHTLQDAVLRNLQTMAEATQRLSAALKTDPDLCVTGQPLAEQSGQNCWSISISGGP